MLTRRTLLLSGTAFTLASCAGTDITTIQTQWNAFVDKVTQQVAAGCGIYQGYIPTVTTIAEAVAALYGPGAQAIVGSVALYVNQVANVLCSAMPVNPPPTLMAKLRGSSPNAPVVINNIVVNGQPVQVVGYSARYGVHRKTYGNVHRLFKR